MFQRDVVCHCLATCVDSCRYVEHLPDVLSPRRVAINYMCTGRWRVFSLFISKPGNVGNLLIHSQSLRGFRPLGSSETPLYHGSPD